MYGSLIHVYLLILRSGVGAPVVSDCDGEYSYDARKHTLAWRVSVVDFSNKAGTMEFSVPGMPNDFFPIKVYFISTKSYCNIEVRVTCSLSKNVRTHQIDRKVWCSRLS